MTPQPHQRCRALPGGGPEAGQFLVGLSVVVGVIGILTAVAVPSYLFVRQRSCDATALSDVLNVGKAIESLDPKTPAFTKTVLGPGHLSDVPGASVSAGTTLFVQYGRSAGQTSYFLRAVHTCGRATFFYVNGRPYVTRATSCSACG